MSGNTNGAYQFALAQGLKSIQGSYAAMGLGVSGGVLLAEANFTISLAAEYHVKPQVPSFPSWVSAGEVKELTAMYVAAGATVGNNPSPPPQSPPPPSPPPPSPVAQSWVVGVGTTNDTVVVGGGGGTVVNSGTNTQIFMTGQGSSPLAIDEAGVFGAPEPSAVAWVRGNVTLSGSTGSTTIHLDTVTGSVAGFASTIIVNNSGDGKNTIDITASSGAAGSSSVNVLSDVIALSGSSSVAATVNAGGSAASGAASTGTQQAEVIGFLSGVANGVFNGGAANVILFGAGAQGSATLFGGSGTDIDAGAGGLIEAGTGGHSLLFGSFTQATTLVGGSSNDILAAISLGQKNTTMIAGSGAETLASFNQGAVFQGVGVSTLMGQGSIAPSTTNMVGEIGGNSFQIGAGATEVLANNLGTNTYQERLSAANGVATITGFDLGSDTVSLTNPAGGKYALGGTGPTGLTFTTGGSDTTIHFGDGTTWTVVGATLANNNFG